MGGQILRNQSQWHISWIAPLLQSMLANNTKLISNSETAISLLIYSTYQHIDDCFKTPIQPTTAKLNTPDGLPMTALGMMALHLRIAEFKIYPHFH